MAPGKPQPRPPAECDAASLCGDEIVVGGLTMVCVALPQIAGGQQTTLEEW